jgi:signal transduction histidine kinase
MYQSPDSEMQYQASQLFLLISERLLLALGISLILYSIHQILITHKFCGPITNFSNTFKKIIEGDLTRKVHLRDSDYLKEEAHCINEMIDVVANTLASIKEENGKLIDNLNKAVITTADSDEKREPEKALNMALKQAQQINDQLSSFKTNNQK